MYSKVHVYELLLYFEQRLGGHIFFDVSFLLLFFPGQSLLVKMFVTVQRTQIEIKSINNTTESIAFQQQFLFMLLPFTLNKVLSEFSKAKKTWVCDFWLYI